MNELDIPDHLIKMANEMLRIAKEMSQGAPVKVTPEERMKYTGTTIDQHGDTSHNYDFKGKLEVFKIPSERKLICEFEDHKYYEGDGTYYFRKDNFEKTDGKAGEGDKISYFEEWESYSKVFPSAALRDAALEEYKKSKEQPEYVECLGFPNTAFIAGKIYKAKGDIILSPEPSHQHSSYDYSFNKEYFKPSTLEAYTRQEILERAKREYPKGTRFKTAGCDSDKEAYVSTGLLRYGKEVTDSIFCLIGEWSRAVYNSETGQWAEIIPTPVIDFNYCLKEYSKKYIQHSRVYDEVVEMCESKPYTEQESKLQAFAKELVVSTVLNGEAKEEEKEWYITVSPSGDIRVNFDYIAIYKGEYYASESIAKQAIEILGPDTIKRARV